MRLIGKVVAINTSDGMHNISIIDEDELSYNLKASLDIDFLIGHVYVFEVKKNYGERVSYQIEEFIKVDSLEMADADNILRKFFPYSDLSLEESKKIIYEYIEKINNEIIYNITKKLINENEKSFFVFPAASRMHHAYVGGLAYHAIGMLRLADSFISNYPFLNSDYLYAGIILHDIGKTVELTGVEATEYTVDGQLLGHLVIGALEINKCGCELGYYNTKELRALEHMLISHHGQPQFGAAKRPMTPEAVALWYIDTIDSKFRVLGEELEKTNNNSFTDTIGVLDKTKIFKE